MFFINSDVVVYLRLFNADVKNIKISYKNMHNMEVHNEAIGSNGNI